MTQIQTSLPSEIISEIIKNFSTPVPIHPNLSRGFLGIYVHNGESSSYPCQLISGGISRYTFPEL